MKIKLILALAIVYPNSTMADQGQENCGEILRYSSRNITHKVSGSDQRKYYYKQICEHSGIGVGIDYKDAEAVFGFSFSSKDEYCSNEKKYDLNTSYTSESSNLVVAESLSAYVKCRALNKEGINTAITLSSPIDPVMFSIAINRASQYPVTINDVRLDPKLVECTSRIDEKLKRLISSSNLISYALPESSEKWTMSCTRKPRIDSNLSKSFDPVQLIVTTSAGDLPLSLNGFGLVADVWASDLRYEINSIGQSVDKKLSNVDFQLKNISETQPVLKTKCLRTNGSPIGSGDTPNAMICRFNWVTPFKKLEYATILDVSGAGMANTFTYIWGKPDEHGFNLLISRENIAGNKLDNGMSYVVNVLGVGRYRN